MIGLSEEKILQQQNYEIEDESGEEIIKLKGKTAVINCNIDNEATIDPCCYQCLLCPPMFFQSKKKGLWKRLWRSRVTSFQEQTENHHQQQQQQQYSPTSFYIDDTTTSYFRPKTTNGVGVDMTTKIKREQNHTIPSSLGVCCTSSNQSSGTLHQDIEYKRFRGLVDKLKERQLETLCQAVEMGMDDKIAMPTDCVLVPRSTILDVEPHVITCRLWKWPDLQNSSELKRIPSCPNDKDPVYACCNPTHWSRLYQPGKKNFFIF